MRKIFSAWIRWCMILIFSTTFIVLPAFGEDVIHLSMMPRFFPEKITKMISPLSECLQKQTGKRIMTVLTLDNTDYEKSVMNGEIDIGYQNPLVYVGISGFHEVLAMALDNSGKKYRGVIIVNENSDIRNINDLIGRRVMIVGRTSGGGYFSPKLTLNSAGIDMERDIEIVEAAANKQENVIISVSIGDVDAGFIRETAFHIADAYIRPKSIRVLHHCAWLPNWAISVKRSMPHSVKAAIQETLIKLNPSDPALRALNIKGFVAASDENYDTFRKALKMDVSFKGTARLSKKPSGTNRP